MAPSLLRRAPLTLLLVTLGSGCQRQPRAREREAAEAEARARKQALEAARRAAEPLPEEPPVELTRVPDSGLPCTVDDVFARKCRRCHTIPTRHGAPFVFFTWDDTRQDRLGLPLYSVIGRAVQSGFMPYKVEANPPVQALTEEEKKIILDWVAAGAPKAACATAATGEKKMPATAEQPAKPAKTRAASSSR